MGKVYVLTETDSTDVKWCYNEVFLSQDSARERLHQLYDEDVIALEDAVLEAKFEDDFAWAETKGGNIISWNIRECEVQ